MGTRRAVIIYIKVNSLYHLVAGDYAHSAAEKEIKNGFRIIKISGDEQLLKAPAAGHKMPNCKKT